MFKNILIATDGSALAQKGVDQGFALAKALGAKVLLVTVTEPWTSYVSGEMAISFPVKEYEDQAASNAAKVLAGLADSATKQGIACDTLHVKDRVPAEGIVETAKARSCDLIVMSSHGRRGLSRVLLGSQANNVVTHSSVPVLICR
ncbi:MAG: universal stress protein [Hyphomicrobiaceae bacterium]